MDHLDNRAPRQVPIMHVSMFIVLAYCWLLDRTLNKIRRNHLDPGPGGRPNHWQKTV